jgi:arabinogalactan oligomer/maltooligosaccharide transport system permease protein
MSRRSPLLESETRSSFAPVTQVTLTFSYFVIFLFTLIALSFSLSLIPATLTLADLAALYSDPAFLRELGSIALIALAVSFTGIAIASPAGYALSRVRWRSPALPRFIGAQLLPPVILILLLLLLLLFKLGLINRYICVLIIYSVTALPFCIWQMKDCYDTIPIALEEAAVLDGCTRWQLFYLIILPLAAPALVVTALFSFLAAWNESLFAPIVLQASQKYIPLGVKISQLNIRTDWNLYAAGALLIAVPIVILFFALSRWLISGLSSGALNTQAVKDYSSLPQS